MRRYFIAFVLSFFIFGCENPDGIYNIKDIKQFTNIILQRQSKGSPTVGIKIKVKGHIDGEADIELILNQKVYKSKNLSGSFNFTWGGDWYSNYAEINYKPLVVKDGSLKLIYTFKTI